MTIPDAYEAEARRTLGLILDNPVPDELIEQWRLAQKAWMRIGGNTMRAELVICLALPYMTTEKRAVETPPATPPPKIEKDRKIKVKWYGAIKDATVLADNGERLTVKIGDRRTELPRDRIVMDELEEVAA